MVLKNVEQDPCYRDVLYDCLDQMKPLVDQVAPGMRVRQGFIFISSAGSVTPFHIDPENNFLLQIRGHKQVQLFDVEDRETMSELQLEQFFTGAHRNIPYLPEFESRGRWYDLMPGDGLHSQLQRHIGFATEIKFRYRLALPSKRTVHSAGSHCIDSTTACVDSVFSRPRSARVPGAITLNMASCNLVGLPSH